MKKWGSFSGRPLHLRGGYGTRPGVCVLGSKVYGGRAGVRLGLAAQVHFLGRSGPRRLLVSDCNGLAWLAWLWVLIRGRWWQGWLAWGAYVDLLLCAIKGLNDNGYAATAL